jgi:release factor glutamine methyltransferase
LTDPYAIRCAKDNAELNHISEKMAFLQGDLFSAFRAGVRFDLILFNAPYLPSEEGEQATWIGRSWAGGANGRLVVDRFISEVPAYFKAGGKCYAHLTDWHEKQSSLRKAGLKAAVAPRSSFLL